MISHARHEEGSPSDFSFCLVPNILASLLLQMANCFFDVSVGDKPLGRVEFKLYDDVVPKTADNFRALCVGDKGKVSGVRHVRTLCVVVENRGKWLYEKH